MSPHSSIHQRTGVDDLPVELFKEIIPHLNIPSIKSLFIASSTLRTICFPHIFRTLSFLRYKYSAFLTDFKGYTPMPCFRTVDLTFVNDNISASLLPWCPRVHTVRISATNLRNIAILPFLSVLRHLNLSYVSFWVIDDYFKLLGNLPPTLKRLTAHGSNFHRLRPTVYTTFGRGADLEYLDTDKAQDLSVLLRDGCPISLASLRVASVPQCRSHDLKDLIQRAPRLLDLRVDFERIKDLPVSLPLPNLKSFSIVDVTDLTNTIIRLLSTPSKLEVLNLTFPLRWLIGFAGLDDPVIAFSQPKFGNLRALNLQS